MTLYPLGEHNAETTTPLPVISDGFVTRDGFRGGILRPSSLTLRFFPAQSAPFLRASADILWHVRCDLPSRTRTERLSSCIPQEYSMNHGGFPPANIEREVLPMKKSLLLRLTILLMIISTLSGCLLVERRDGFHPGDSHEKDRGNHRGNKH